MMKNLAQLIASISNRNCLMSNPIEIRWKTLLSKSLIWIVAEILLSCLGVDTLADYSEFVFDKTALVRLS